VVIRLLDLPAEVTDNLKQVVTYQVQSYEPTDEEKYYYDFVAYKASPGSKRIQVLLTMIKCATLDGYLQVLAELGIRPAVVTVGAVGLANLVAQECRPASGQTVILADPAQDGIGMLVLRNGLLLHSHEAPKNRGETWKDSVLRGMESAAEKARMGPDDTIDRLVLAGDLSAEVGAELAEAVGECELAGGCVKFEMPPENGSHVQEAAASIGLAYTGLARRPSMKLNLLPAERRHRQARWAYVPSVILGMVILALFGAIGARRMVQERSLTRRLDLEISALQDRVDRVQKLRAESKQLEEEVRFVESLLQKRDMNLEVLQELTTILPPDTFLGTYQNKDGQIQISGSSSAAPDLLPMLERSPRFRDVVQRGQVFRDPQTGKDRFVFDMKLER
jgi:Tfp pilus assembly protein PilN